MQTRFHWSFPNTIKDKAKSKFTKSIKPFFDNFYAKFEKDPPIEDSYKDMENMSIQGHGAIGNLYQWLSMKTRPNDRRAEKKHGVRYDWVI